MHVLELLISVISSAKNDTMKAVAKLKRGRERRRTGQILVEGPNLFRAAVDAGLLPKIVLATETDTATAEVTGRLGVPLTLVTESVLASVADAAHPRSPIAVFEQPGFGSVPDVNIVVLVDLADPGNAGTIIRSAASFGWAVGVTPHTVDIWSPKSLRSGAGAHFSLPIVVIDDVETTFSGLRHTVVAAVVHGGEAKVSNDGPFALLVGSEAHGLSHEQVAAADVALTIPMAGGFESLNAAVAASIAMFTLS
ncbi:MAG: RNA methyltransferase [Acidimicrobiia bacterium]|nr:RNA methyltransferase [Acidimicrobiia bacterium]